MARTNGTRSAGVADPGTADVIRRASTASGTDPSLLAGYLDILLRAARTGRGLTAADRSDRRQIGRRAAEDSVALGTLVDVYLRATRLAWTELLEAPKAGHRDVTAAVLRVANDAIVALATGYDDAQRAAIRSEEALRREFVDDLLHGGDPGRLAERAGRFGLALAARHIVAVIRDERPFTDTDERTRRLAEVLRNRLSPSGVLVSTKDGLLVCVAQSSDSAAVGDHLRNAVARDDPGTIGIGRPHAGAGGVARSYDEARTALELAGRLGVSAHDMLSADLLVYQVLGRDRAAMVDLVDTVLAPLEHTRGGARPLLDTLTAYFRAGNAMAAARTLHLSVRALTYRLARIHRLTGYDPTSPVQRYTLETAVIGARLLGWPEAEASESE
ncbi:PucR family transcriptional regulator [Virgisporangium ochraceum]|nr:helix-turn-helix domain-containing protein [Virgisporangium ochraceum]